MVFAVWLSDGRGSLSACKHVSAFMRFMQLMLSLGCKTQAFGGVHGH